MPASYLIDSTTSSFLGPTKYPLVGNYYVELSEDGDPSLRFDDPQLGPVYLKYAVATGVAKDYVVTYGASCYLFPVAATAEAARRARIGPLTEAACRQKVFQLTGDSLRLTRFAL
jgi:hypothetical protein